MDGPSEAAAVEIAAQGVIGKRVDEMEAGFMMALDYMIKLADKDQDDQVCNNILLCYVLVHFVSVPRGMFDCSGQSSELPLPKFNVIY